MYVLVFQELGIQSSVALQIMLLEAGLIQILMTTLVKDALVGGSSIIRVVYLDVLL